MSHSHSVCNTIHLFFNPEPDNFAETIRIQFIGTFTAGIAEGCALAEAVVLANCAGALATLKPGAQEAMPTRLATQLALRRSLARTILRTRVEFG